MAVRVCTIEPTPGFGLSKIAVGRTVLMISHRLSTLVNADAILVMQQGKLADSGRHEELLSRSPTLPCGLHYEVRPLDPELCTASDITNETPPA